MTEHLSTAERISNPRKGPKWLLWGCVLLLGTAAHSTALASNCPHPGGTIPIDNPSLTDIEVLPNAPVGQRIAEWSPVIEMGDVSPACTLPNGVHAIYGLMHVPFASKNPVFREDGVTHVVWESGLAGVGIVYQASVRIGSGPWSRPYGLVSGLLTDADLGVPLAPGTYPVSFRIKFAYVKYDTISPGRTVPSAKFADWGLAGSGDAAPQELLLALGHTQSVNVRLKQCAASDVLVTMGSHAGAGFTGVGSTVGTQDFDINLTGCSAGMAAVDYRLDPAPGINIVDAANGVVGLDAGSSATGVGVQITDRSDVPVVYGDSRPTSYVPAGGDVTIPLRASYFQWEPQVAAGTANSLVTFTLDYR